MKVLVTGGAGFIGSHIAEELLKQHYEVVVVDNLITGNRENIPLGVTFYQADVREDLSEIFTKEKPDFVIHQAAQVSVAHSMNQPIYDSEENIISTINLLEASVNHNIKKFVFASSAALYGNPEYLAIDEKHVVNPISFYGLSKLNAESYIQLFSRLYGLSYTILRYANVYGMRQDTKGEAGVVAIFIEQALKGESPTIFGDGEQTRDFVFVKDVAKANVASLHNGDNEVINISNCSQTSVLEIINNLSEITGKPVSPTFQPERPGDIRHSYLSNLKALKLLNWYPSYEFFQGIEETIAYYEKGLIKIS
ncbi:UDP-glucose 4-epimerase [Halobacillus andaensis]|uniref:UDP-glucose 4-epimerase n=1 Tax=Halobacillus andaensis TaxID=1176239 RepID=A0A917EZ82_HALAA|nr:NAD-dependent epimerase/dehydratase family protein [Halobacillus andaensis]MBP2005805.1 UDP-glucose 4-epimerase [Halobacillus andaensis]GGF25924.1 UDP-glucose 4-epimerase [Halobacillus andaensis]